MAGSQTIAGSGRWIRRRRSRTRVATAIAAIGLWPGVRSALGHEFWLAPSTYLPRPAAVVEVRACVGTGFRGDPLAYSPARTVRFELIGAGAVDLAGRAIDGGLSYARCAPEDSTGALLVYESGFSRIELPPGEFDRYLAQEGLDEVLAARRAAGPGIPGRERFRRCAKAWIAGTEGERATRPCGLPFEIIPLQDPSTSGPELTVRLLAGGRPQPGALVRAWCQPCAPESRVANPAGRDSVGPCVEARSDREGVARLRVDRSGEWLIAAVRMVPADPAKRPSEADGGADWESTWASFTFLRP